MKAFLSMAFLVFFVPSTLAQKSDVVAELSFLGPTPTAISLPLPVHPRKNIPFDGIVSVSVTVDESGSVVTTDDGEGPYPVCKNVTDTKVLSLRAAAVEAAKKAKFAPAMVDSKSAATTGRIIYYFKTEDSRKMVESSPSGSTEGMRLDRMTTIGNADVASGAQVVKSDGQGALAGKPGMVSGGVLNGKAEALARPSYPSAAKAVRAGGSVAVQVVISENGEIYTAAAVSGHPLLRRSSEIAACSSSFSPTLLEGNPVKVSGVITYNYVP